MGRWRLQDGSGGSRAGRRPRAVGFPSDALQEGAKSGAPTHAEWRRTRRLPVRLLVPRLNDGGDALQMAFELIAERCWRDNPVHKAARKTLADVGGARACIRLLEAQPAAGRYTAVHARALTLLVM